MATHGISMWIWYLSLKKRQPIWARAYSNDLTSLNHLLPVTDGILRQSISQDSQTQENMPKQMSVTDL